MAEEWYYTEKGKQTGPVSAAQIREMAESGELKPTDLVWNEDMPKWVRASTVPELFPNDVAFKSGGPASQVLPTSGSSASPTNRDDDIDDDDKRPRRKSRSRPDRDDDDDDAGRRERRRVRRAKSSGNGAILAVVLGLVAAGLVFIGIIVVIVVVAMRGRGAAGPDVIMTYNVDLPVQGRDIRPITLISGNRYEFTVKAANQAGDLDIFITDNQNEDLAKDDGKAADAFIDFTAPYSGLYRIDIFNEGLMANQGTITVVDKGKSLNPPNQVIALPQNLMPKNAQPPVVAPPMPQPKISPPPVIAPPVPPIPKKQDGTFVKQIPGDMFAFIKTAAAENRLMDVDIAGFTVGNNRYRDTSSDGGVLIGLQLGTGKFTKFDVINALCPIYLTPGGEKMGNWFGPLPANPITLKAKPGYVVGGANLRTSIHIDGLSLRFVKLDAGQLQLADNYDSNFVGTARAGANTIGNRGYFITGITGHTNNKNAPFSLGFVAVLDVKK